jgi:hypothetical protein
MILDEDEEEAEEEEEEELLAESGFGEQLDWDPIFGPGFETDPNHAQHGFPRIATTRNNLTALSQRYNVRAFAPSGGDRC